MRSSARQQRSSAKAKREVTCASAAAKHRARPYEIRARDKMKQKKVKGGIKKSKDSFITGVLTVFISVLHTNTGPLKT